VIRGRRAGQRLRPPRPTARVAFAGAGALSICAGTAVAVHLGVFFFHSSVAGGDLVRQERKAIAGAASSPAACQRLSAQAPGAQASGAQQPEGLLEVSVLGMVAPVLQGTGDSVLADAVGHDPSSAWPGQQGTSVLSAHDVTWFSSIGKLKPGDEIRYVTPCRTYTYQVTSHAIVNAGTPVYDNGTARLVLDTCYPLDALYLTPTRYLLYSTLVSSAPTNAAVALPGSWPAPVVPAPPALAAQGLTLGNNNSAPLGTLRLTGSPARAWAQSSAPLNFEAAALAAYFGIIRSAAQERRDWWADLAPAVPAPTASALWGGQLDSYVSALTVTLRAEGTRDVAATLAAAVAVSGAQGTGRYDLSVSETAGRGKLYVTGVRVTALQVTSVVIPFTYSPSVPPRTGTGARTTRTGSPTGTASRATATLRRAVSARANAGSGTTARARTR
jgi:sortase A